MFSNFLAKIYLPGITTTGRSQWGEQHKNTECTGTNECHEDMIKEEELTDAHNTSGKAAEDDVACKSHGEVVTEGMPGDTAGDRRSTMRISSGNGAAPVIPFEGGEPPVTTRGEEHKGL